MNGEIICVGTELLLGDVLNTHATFISRNIAPLGINMFYHSVVGDNEKRLRQLVRTAFERSDIIFFTGGLGPTYDDITKNVVYNELALVPFIDPDALKKLRAYFHVSGREMTENNLVQVMRPENAFFFENDFGTAPGICIEHEGKVIILLPGPPRELVPMFENKVMPYLMKLRDRVLFSRSLRYFGIGEAALEDKIRNIMENATNPTVAPYVDNFEVKLRVTASSDTIENAKALVDGLIDELREKTEPYCYGVDVNGLEEALVNHCSAKGVKITTAESCTGGLVSERITAVPGASAVFDMSVCCYADEKKTALLGVRPDTLAQYGAVSEQVAIEMAHGAVKASGADFAVSVTGIAGPDGGTPEKPVGTVFIAVADKNGKAQVKRLSLGTNTRTRADIRLLASSHALKMLLDFID